MAELGSMEVLLKTRVRDYVIHHVFYIVLIIVGIVAGHCWLTEHDDKVLAQQQMKQSDARVKDLQAQIVSTNAAAAAQVKTVVQIVHDAKTPVQQIAAIPQLTDAPLNARTVPGLPDGVVAVDLAPLVTELGQCKQDAINLGACTQNLNTCQQIVKEREAEIVVLKKKPNFMHRVVGVAKAVGVGIGIGLLLGGHV